MKNILVILNHKLTPEQVQDLEKMYSDTTIKIHILPENLQKLWGNIPPDASPQHILEIAERYLQYTIENYIHIAIVQGESGITFALITLLHNYGFLCLHACTKRVSKEVVNTGGTIEKKSIFQHVQFREYAII